MIKKEAEELVLSIKPWWYCPLIRDACKTDCVCYERPYIRNVYEEGDSGYDTNFYVRGNRCTCYSLVGGEGR